MPPSAAIWYQGGLASSRLPAFSCIEVTAFASQEGTHADIRYACDGIATASRSIDSNTARKRIETLHRDHVCALERLFESVLLSITFGGPAVWNPDPLALRPCVAAGLPLSL